MCGFLGEFSVNKTLTSSLNFEELQALSKHRGPDSSETFKGNNYQLGFNRLAILDLSDNGNQPKRSPSGNCHLVFNGEIYNYKELLKEYLQKWGVPENKIYVIPVSFGKKTEAKPKFPSKDVMKIVSALRMCWEKNIEGNLRVIKLLKEKNIKVQYHIYGSGQDDGQVFYLIDKYNLQNEVTYYGKIENKTFKERLPNYELLLQLSHSESFGASVVEGQSKGVPAIISNAGGLPETIIENETGYCVNSWEIEKASKLIINLWSNPEKYFRFSELAIKNAQEKFTLQIEIDKLLLYNKLVSR